MAGRGLAPRTRVAKGMQRLLLVASVLVTLTAYAQEPAEPNVLPHAAHGVFTGDEWRYRKRPELEGRYYGPVEAVKLWPAGTPSGHMASMYALLSVVMHAVDHPGVWVGLNALALVFGASLVGDNYHWVSDVILGAAIGFCVGRWVVRHRSTFYVYGRDSTPLVHLGLAPLVLPGSGAGLGVVGSF